MKNAMFLTNNEKLIEHFRRLNKYAVRAQEAVELLPDCEWEVDINIFGDVDIFARNYAKAHDALVDAGFSNRLGSDFYFKNNCIITLTDIHDRV